MEAFRAHLNHLKIDNCIGKQDPHFKILAKKCSKHPKIQSFSGAFSPFLDSIVYVTKQPVRLLFSKNLRQTTYIIRLVSSELLMKPFFRW